MIRGIIIQPEPQIISMKRESCRLASLNDEIFHDVVLMRCRRKHQSRAQRRLVEAPLALISDRQFSLFANWEVQIHAWSSLPGVPAGRLTVVGLMRRQIVLKGWLIAYKKAPLQDLRKCRGTQWRLARESAGIIDDAYSIKDAHASNT